MTNGLVSPETGRLVSKCRFFSSAQIIMHPVPSPLCISCILDLTSKKWHQLALTETRNKASANKNKKARFVKAVVEKKKKI